MRNGFPFLGIYLCVDEHGEWVLRRKKEIKRRKERKTNPEEEEEIKKKKTLGLEWV